MKKVRIFEDFVNEDNPCWDDYKLGDPKTKKSDKTGKRVNNCVPKNEEIEEASEKLEDVDKYIEEKLSLSEIKKIIKTKEYKEVLQATNNAEEASDIWNMLDPKMFKFTESEFEDIFNDWWNDQSYDSLGEFSTGGSTEDMISLYNHLLPYVTESYVTEKREDVGKYNTVKKVIAELGRRPSEQKLATFINNNYYDVTEVERGDDDSQANDKIADLVAFYKFDIDDWEIAWADAQNESVVTEAKEIDKPMGLERFAQDERDEGKNVEIHLATFDGSGMEAQSTSKTWDDGVPVTKNFTRGGYKRVAPKKGQIWIIESDKFWYFKNLGVWYAVKRADYSTPPFEY